MELELDRQHQAVDGVGAGRVARRPAGRSVVLAAVLIVAVVAGVAAFAVLGGRSREGVAAAVADLRTTQTLLGECAARSADGVYTGCADAAGPTVGSDVEVVVDGDGLGFTAARTATDGTTFRLRSRFSGGERRTCEPDGGRCEDGAWR